MSNDVVLPTLSHEGIDGTGFEFLPAGAHSSAGESCDLDFVASVGPERIGIVAPGFSAPSWPGLFADSGQKTLAFWGGGTATVQQTAIVLFDTVDLTGVAAAEVVVRWMAPMPLEFETTDRGLVITLNTDLGPILTSFNGTALAASTAGYQNQIIPVPPGAAFVGVRIAFTSNEATEQVWVDNVHVRLLGAQPQIVDGGDPGDPMEICNPDGGAIDSDADGDGICGDVDNCVGAANPGQEDCDADGLGDVCDPCPLGANSDPDGDGACGEDDNCVMDANPGQEDNDGDGAGDVCDICPLDPDNDSDADGLCSDVDPCPNDSDNDGDGDGLCGDVDVCPADPDNDGDGDGMCGNVDPCPNDSDNDGDGDGLCGDVDVCPADPDNDGDNDGLCGDVDFCPDDPDNDGDNDGLCGDIDLCPNDSDNDGDGDGICGDVDICRYDPNNDNDNDGVCGDIDLCAGTVADAPTKGLAPNNWGDLDLDGVFDTTGGNPTGRSYTLQETLGCTCTQIGQNCGNPQGIVKHGCSDGVMDAWTGKYSAAGDPVGSCM